MDISNPLNLSLNIPHTEKPRVVIVGGGFGGVYTAKKIDTRYFQVVLFDKHNYHTFQPLLYQVATAALQPDSIVGPLRKIFNRYKDIHFRMLKVFGVDPEMQKIFTSAGALHYDHLIIATGMKTNFFGNKEIEQFALPMKTIPNALNLRSHLMQMFEWASMTTDPELQNRILTIVLAGAGPTGVELAGALSELRKYVLPKDYPQVDFSKMKIYLVDGLPRVLPPMSEKAGNITKKSLEKLGIIVKTNTLVEGYDGRVLKFKSGETIDTYTVIWSAGVTGEAIEGLKKEWIEKGRILTDTHCKIIGSKNIYAIGDIALMRSNKYPKGHPGVAQPAIQMGKYLGRNLKAMHEGKDVEPFEYFDKGSLATIGRGRAVADIGKFHFGGRPAWWIWLFVHLTFLITFRNKLFVLVNWFWNYITFDKGNRLIIRPYIQSGSEIAKKIFTENETAK
jgi:NADH dehydrogenase